MRQFATAYTCIPAILALVIAVLLDILAKPEFVPYFIALSAFLFLMARTFVIEDDIYYQMLQAEREYRETERAEYEAMLRDVINEQQHKIGHN